MARYRLLSEPTSPVSTLGRAGRELLTPLVAVRLGARSARDHGLEIAAGGASTTVGGFAELLDGEAVIEAIKQAHDGDGWIVRLHEVGGRPGSARLRLRWPSPVHAARCDLFERPPAGASPIRRDGELLLEADLTPFGTASWAAT